MKSPLVSRLIARTWRWGLAQRCGGLLFLAALLVTLATVGCSSADPQLAEVSGRVTFYGRPVPAEVVFQPLSSGRGTEGRPSSAHTDANGYYRLFHTQDQAGAFIGRHAVTIKIQKTPDQLDVDDFGKTTTVLKFARFERDVWKGGNLYDFALTY